MAEKARVAISKIKRENTYAALREAVELLGGIRDIVSSGSKVLLKPNFFVAPTDSGITHPEAIEAAARLVAEAGADEIYIGEGSADCYTPRCFRLLGIHEIAARYGARVVDLNVEEGVKIPVPADLGREYVIVPRTVVECDVLISVPVFKLWGTPMSLSLKNLFGLFPGRYYGYNKSSRGFLETNPEFVLTGEVGGEKPIHEPGLKETLAAINLAVETHLAVIDAIEGLDGQGNGIRLDLIIAGKNALATDCVALAAAGFVPQEQEVFRFCSERGLGPCRLEDIEVVGERIEDVYFDLTRLEENILELSVEECLQRISYGELQQMVRALEYFHLLPKGMASAGEEALRARLAERMRRPDYLKRALELAGEKSGELLKLIVKKGGTSGDFYAIQKEFQAAQQNGYVFYPALRNLERLGLVYLLSGMNRSYLLLPEGLASLIAET